MLAHLGCIVTLAIGAGAVSLPTSGKLIVIEFHS
jgi:hypothetical protein